MVSSKPGVMIYFETGKAIKGLDYETKGRLFEAIMEYAEFGVVPEFDGVLSAVWPFVADKIDRDSARYEEIRQTRSEAGRKGGLASASKRKKTEANEAFACFGKQIKPTATATTAATATATATTTTDATATTDATEGIRDNVLRDHGLNLTIQPNTNISDMDDSNSESMKRKAMKKLEKYAEEHHAL